MKRLRQFSYFEPITIKEAVEVLAEKGSGAYLLAGGTDLLVRMKREDITPTALVNLKRINALNEIKSDKNGMRIGALSTISSIENSQAIKTSYPVLSQAAGTLGNRSIRNLATIGGNIGRASPASDMSPALIVLQAKVAAEGPSGKREMEIENVFTGPGATSLGAAEIITAFILPDMAPNTGAAYLKMGRRSGGGDCALVGVAVLLTMSNGEAGDIRIVFSSVGPKPMRARHAEEVIMSGTLTEERMQEAARTAEGEMSDMRCSASYRRELIRVLTFRALQEAQQKAQGGIIK